MRKCKNMDRYLKDFVIGGLFLLILCGCSSKEKEHSKENVEAFLKAYQVKDQTCGKYLSGNARNTTVEFEGFQAIFAEPITFEIKSVEIEKEYSIVNALISNVDFEAVFEDLLRDNLNMDAADDIVLELEKRLQEDTAPMREFEVPVRLDEEQKIEMTSELSNALLGGYTQYIYELTEGEVQ